MESDATQPAKPVPEKLIEELHKANEHFHDARKHLETQMEDTDFSHQVRVDAAAEGVRAAEKEVEAISEKIRKELHPSEDQSGNPG